MMKTAVLLIAAACAVLPACNKIDPGTPGKVEAAELVPIELTEVEQAVNVASNAFGLKLFRELQEEGKNMAISPLSISLALSMAAEGANGDTYAEMARVLGWGDAGKEEVGAYYKKMIDGLKTADRNVLFTSANSCWIAKDFTVKPDYMKALTDYYAADAASVDFSLKKTYDEINRWCSDKTDGKIPTILDKQSPNYRMVLINALLFKAPWAVTWTVKPRRRFNAEAGAHYNSKKDYLYVEDEELSYKENEDFEYVGIPYGNGTYKMDIIFPKERKSLSGVLAGLHDDYYSGAARAKVTLYLPKWSEAFKAEDELLGALKKLGLRLPFSPDADFSGISEEPLLINMIIHKTQVDVTETGTEFAAATALTMVFGSANPTEPELKRVTVDHNRPFLYVIRETTSGAILLMGAIKQ